MRIIPLIGISAAGVAGLAYLPRFWLKAELRAVTALPDGYVDIDRTVDEIVFPALGIDPDQALAFLQSLPSYMEFERWVGAHAKDICDRTSAVNAAVQAFALPADLTAWQALHEHVKGGRRPDQPEIVPAVSSNAVGPLGALHLPRLWAKGLLHATGFLPDGYNTGRGGADTFAATSLGLDMAASVQFITEQRPAYPAYEAWVIANGRHVDPAVVAAYNTAAALREKPEAAAAEIREFSGVADATLRRTIVLNDLDDWHTLHQAVRAQRAAPPARLRTKRSVTSSLDAGAALPARLAGKREIARNALAQAFTGVTADGKPVPALFPVRETGLSLEPLVHAATAFLASLAEGDRRAATFAIDSAAWRSWHNIHPNLMRHGICLEEAGERQRALALALVRESMSAAGYALATGIMKLNEHLGRISGRPEEFGEWFYWLSIMGTPSVTEPWGWQIDGHHLIVNCFVLGDQIVLTPNFMGSEPVVAATEPFMGTRVFAQEEEAGWALMTALTPEQRARATIATMLPVDVLGGAACDNLVLPYEGIPYSVLSQHQRELLLQLIEIYVGRVCAGHAAIELEAAKAHLQETHFAWIGTFGEGNPFYYRVHSPVVLIEFDHQAGTVFDNLEPSRNHVHTVVRTPNGNDYGKDLLRAHYRRFDHQHAGSAHRQGLE